MTFLIILLCGVCIPALKLWQDKRILTAVLWPFLCFFTLMCFVARVPVFGFLCIGFLGFILLPTLIYGSTENE